jgi:hypothetical protein
MKEERKEGWKDGRKEGRKEGNTPVSFANEVRFKGKQVLDVVKFPAPLTRIESQPSRWSFQQ